MRKEREMKAKQIRKKLIAFVCAIALVFSGAAYMNIANVSADSEDTSVLKTDKTTYAYGEPVMVTADCNNAGAWVGLYKKNEEPGSGLYSIFWYYVSSYKNKAVDISLTSGNQRDTDFSTGEYKIILFGADPGYDQQLKQIDIKIEEPEPVDDVTGTMTVEKDSYIIGDSINVTATCTNPYKNSSWVGLYKENDAIDGSVQSMFWTYLSSVGETFDITQGTQNRAEEYEPGNYKLVLYGTSDWSKPLKTIPITISEQVPISDLSGTLSVEKENLEMGKPIMVTATCTNPNPKSAWVGLYLEDDFPSEVESIHWNYLSSVNETFDITADPINPARASDFVPGKYKLVLFGTDDKTKPLKTVHFTLDYPSDVQFSLSTDKTEYLSTEPIMVTASCELSSAWVGLYKEEDIIGEVGSFCWDWVNEHSEPFNLKAFNYQRTDPMTAGKYKVILFGSGAYNYPLQTLEITINRIEKSRNIIMEPSCSSDGLADVEYEDNPGKYELENIPALGHDFEGVEWEFNPVLKTRTKTCKRCHGEEEGGVIYEGQEETTSINPDEPTTKTDEPTTAKKETTKKPVVTTKATTKKQGKKTVVKAPAKSKVKKAIKKKSAKKIKITLAKANGAKGYQVAVYKSKKNAKKNKKAIAKKFFANIKIAFKSKKFKNKKKLFVKSRAYTLNGNKKVFGSWSKITKVKSK